MKIFLVTFLSTIITLLTGVVFAEEPPTASVDEPSADTAVESSTTSPLLQFYSVNAGYKDDVSAQNYDFIELRATTENLSLADYSIVYFNSAGNEGGHIDFTAYQTLTQASLVLGFAKSPQYADFVDTAYTYNFGSSGLASTAGKLQLFQNDVVVDEICWGKLECAHSNSKFATKQEDNLSLVRCLADECTDTFSQEAYYPTITESIVTVEPPVEEVPSCDGLIISEILTYYTDSPSEQFVELYNSTHESINLANCNLIYKSKSYPLAGELAALNYYVYQNPSLTFTKDPSSYNRYALSNTSGDISYELVLPHGQKKGASYAVFRPESSGEQ